MSHTNSPTCNKAPNHHNMNITYIPNTPTHTHTKSNTIFHTKSNQIGVIKVTDSDTFNTILHTLACIQLIWGLIMNNNKKKI
jgi:hypothetical protein